MNGTEPRAGTPSVFFTKQPILDAKRSIWGYELLGGSLKEGLIEAFSRQGSAAGISSNTYLGLQEALGRGKKIMVAFTQTEVLSGMPHAFPPASSIVRVLPGGALEPALEETLQALRAEGYRAVLEELRGSSLPENLYRQADIISFDLSGEKPGPAWVERMERLPVRMLARGVKTQDQFLATRELGFALFQGPFFKEPEYQRDRPLGSNEVARLNLFRLIEAEEPDVKILAEAIRSDVSVSFRLLSYLNSAWFGFRHNIQSIDQAIMILGWIKLKSWLRAVLFIDLAGREEVPQELAALSLQRGKFLELLGTRFDYWGFQPSTLFLLGLFSLMDSILGLPMETVVELLPLDAKLKAALRRDPNNEYRPLFTLLESLEDGDWATLDTLAQQLFLDPELIRESFAQARDWTGGFFSIPHP